MRAFSVHIRDGRAPVLVAERFAWSAFVFGPLWLAAQRAWVAAALALLAGLAVGLAPPPWRAPLALALAVLLGLFGHDLRRWSLARRGFALAHVVVAADADAAFARLLQTTPELLEAAARP